MWITGRLCDAVLRDRVAGRNWCVEGEGVFSVVEIFSFDGVEKGLVRASIRKKVHHVFSQLMHLHL
jgi:hypothetical protein